MAYTPIQQTTHELLMAMEHNLNELAYYWRSTGDEQAIRQYQTVLRAMIELGFDEELDVDAELPDKHMPQEYLQLHRS